MFTPTDRQTDAGYLAGEGGGEEKSFENVHADRQTDAGYLWGGGGVRVDVNEELKFL